MENLFGTQIQLDLWELYRLQKSPVVVVYVWRSTTALDRRRTKADYEPRYTNDRDSSRLFRSVGHAGIGIKYNGQFIYRGFGPLQTYKEIQLINPAGSFKAVFNTYAQDVELMKSEPECKIYLYNLDFERVYSLLVKPENSWKTYNLYTKNCSTFVLNALKYGSNGIKPTFWKRTKRFWNNAYDVAKAFAWVFPGVRAQQRMYWARMVMYDSNPVLAMDHIFKTLGGDTPDAVLRYAHFLETYQSVKQ